ncbi:MAG: hypothetical protein LBS21_09300 [Clostridiales bacterium]|jgi:hypothetical protein|nr:hypothetical protein [Clostridiales bacterium]
MDVYENTVIYILTPEKVATGGPNCLHQLCYKLRRYNFKAFIYYYPFDMEGPQTHPNYVKYGNPVIDYIVDAPENIVICPETATARIAALKNTRKAIWWLSVYYYYASVFLYLKKRSNLPVFNINSPEDVFHFTDCFYAKKNLEFFDIPNNKISMLESYVNRVFIDGALSNRRFPKKNYVTFNPKKGLEFTNKVLKYCMENGYEDIAFVSLENMTPEKLSDVYKMSKLHIDFGPFPGREYIPREAAVNDMCVITGRFGASKYYEDVPIPDEYKIDATEENLPRIAEKIRYCLNNYETCLPDFKAYKDFAFGLERKFEEDIKSIFKKTYTGGPQKYGR